MLQVKIVKEPGMVANICKVLYSSQSNLPRRNPWGINNDLMRLKHFFFKFSLIIKTLLVY